MPWMEFDVSTQRQLIVALAQAPGANISRLSETFGLSRKTIYKWVGRAKRCDAKPCDAKPEEAVWAKDHSRRPTSCPWRTDQTTEDLVEELRREYPCWGPRKLRCLMERRGAQRLPSASTIAAILKRRNLVKPEESLKRQEFTRFERSEPNALWQMDFKGPFQAGKGKCHPLTVVDDHSRFALGVTALPGEAGELTRPALTEIFRRYGLPYCMLLDNGSCWGRVEASYTAFTAWLLRLGVRVIYARPYHPQTKGKNERFNRTLKAEAIRGRLFGSLEDCQKEFDRFLITYNTVRPHEALQMAVPASRYQVSLHSFPEHLPQIEYLEGDIIRKVGVAGYISMGKQRYHVGRAFTGDPVALRPTCVDGVFEVFYCYQRVAIIDKRERECRQT